MASAGRPPASKPISALSSLLGHVGHSRADVGNPYLLRVSRRAWEDLGEASPPKEPPEEAAAKHRIVRKFYDEFSAADRVDGGVPIDTVEDPKVFRIKSGDWRAAVRYVPADGVVWMCRALSLANFNDEQHAYVEFGRLYDAGLLLPDDAEQKLARGDHFLVGAVLALSQARVNADNDPRTWWGAYATRPDGRHHRIGRIYAERELDEEGEYVTRFLLLVAAPPTDVTVRDDWREFVLHRIFPSDEPIMPAFGGLPAGTNREPDELPFVQETIELRDEDETY